MGDHVITISSRQYGKTYTAIIDSEEDLNREEVISWFDNYAMPAIGFEKVKDGK